MKATATAHPIQGLVKYHGLADAHRRIPYHGSISICTAPTMTTTTVEVLDAATGDRLAIDGVEATGRPRERALAVLDAVRAVAETRASFRVVSTSNFPQQIGLGSSASGFAALAKAACSALGLPLDDSEISELARLGAGSATRSVTGGISEWITRGQRSYGRCLAPSANLDWSIVAVAVPHAVPTEGAHAEVQSSPYFRARVDAMGPLLERARDAVRRSDVEQLMAIGEADTLNLHAVTMTAKRGLVAWRGVSVEAMHAVRRLRETGTPCWFSIDTGATVYVNSRREHQPSVVKGLAHLAGIDGVQIMELGVGGAAQGIQTHLF